MHTSVLPFLDAVMTSDMDEAGTLSVDSTAWDGPDVTIHVTLREPNRSGRGWALHAKAVRGSRLLRGNFGTASAAQG